MTRVKLLLIFILFITIAGATARIILFQTTNAQNQEQNQASGELPVYRLRNSNDRGSADLVLRFGERDKRLIPVIGDWIGNGIDTIGVYDPVDHVFRLRNINERGSADIRIVFTGINGESWLPVVGDWDGDGTDTTGIYNPLTREFVLLNSNDNVRGPADLAFTFGPRTDNAIPVAGDWNGDGLDRVGVFDPDTFQFWLSSPDGNEIRTRIGNFDVPIMPVVGDWDGDGIDTIGIFSPTERRFRLLNVNERGSPDLNFVFAPNEGTWLPIAGDWDGDGIDTIGVWQN